MAPPVTSFVGLLLAALLLPQQDVPDRVHANVPSVRFEATDVRQALRILGRQGLIGITVEPGVLGPVTLELQNVEWEVALQNVTRQVDATYRFERGWLYVVHREDDFAPYVPPRGLDPLAEAYERLARAVATGSRVEVRRLLAPTFEVRNATETKRGAAAYRAVVDAFRTSTDYTLEGTSVPGKAPRFFNVVAYRRRDAPPIVFRDEWFKTDGAYRLVSRERTVRNPVRRFRNALLSEVLRAIFKDVSASVRMNPALDRRVTVDLTGATFETDLQWLVRSTDLTYRIEGGVYEIVRRDP